ESVLLVSGALALQLLSRALFEDAMRRGRVAPRRGEQGLHGVRERFAGESLILLEGAGITGRAYEEAHGRGSRRLRDLGPLLRTSALRRGSRSRPDVVQHLGRPAGRRVELGQPGRFPLLRIEAE